MKARVHLTGAVLAVAVVSSHLLLASRVVWAQSAGDVPPAPLLPPLPPLPPPVLAGSNEPPVFPAPPLAPPVAPRRPFQPSLHPNSAPFVPPVSPLPTVSIRAPVVWDAMSKDYTATPGQRTNMFVFSVTNVSTSVAYIQKLRPSCGCTVAKLPSEPWRLDPGASGDVYITIDLTGKFGLVHKSIFVDGLEVLQTTSVSRTNTFLQTLSIHVNIPSMNGAPPMAMKAPRFGNQDRLQNLAMAKADRQAVFKGDCASCHAAPAHGKSGGELFQAVCGVCHTDPNRASMVPDLAGPKPGVIRNEAYWMTWIESGRPGTLMPAFSDDPSIGGPLTSEQISSLAAYLAKTYPARGARAR